MDIYESFTVELLVSVRITRNLISAARQPNYVILHAEKCADIAWYGFPLHSSEVRARSIQQHQFWDDKQH